MEKQLGTTATATTTNVEEEALIHSKPDLQNPNHGEISVADDGSMNFEDIDSSCSTPFVSAPSSPGRGQPIAGGGGFFYSAPASPMHFVLCSVSPSSTAPVSETSVSSSFEFEFSARFGTNGPASGGSMSSADELFLNGQIRPMKLSSHLQRPQALAPLLDLDEDEGDYENGTNDAAEMVVRGRDVKWRDRSLRRRTRSMSPLRTPSFQWHDVQDEEKTEITEPGVGLEALESKNDEAVSCETTPSMSASSSRSSSASRSSKRWVFLKDLLYRSKSEGRNNGHKFWSSISFSPVKDRKASTPASLAIPSQSATPSQEKMGATESAVGTKKEKQPGVKDPNKKAAATPAARKATNGVAGKRRVPLSPHELHYKASRAQAEEMRKKTFLPYRQGLLGCLGFSSKSYGAMNGFARALNPVSSR